MFGSTLKGGFLRALFRGKTPALPAYSESLDSRVGRR
jgi:hypothetical protein